MYLLIRYAAGEVVEGVVLAKGRNGMRVASPGFADTIELQRCGPNWIVAGRECVELEFIMSRSSDALKTDVWAIGFASAN